MEEAVAAMEAEVEAAVMSMDTAVEGGTEEVVEVDMAVVQVAIACLT